MEVWNKYKVNYFFPPTDYGIGSTQLFDTQNLLRKQWKFSDVKNGTLNAR